MDGFNSFFEMKGWGWSSSWPLNDPYCPLKTHAKDIKKEKKMRKQSWQTRYSHTAKPKNPLAKPLTSQEKQQANLWHATTTSPKLV